MDFKERTLSILDGDEEPPNEFIGYLVKRATESRDTGNKLVDQVKQVEANLVVMRSKIQQLKGACDSYVSDIEVLLEKEQPTEDAEKGNGETKTFTDVERQKLLGNLPSTS